MTACNKKIFVAGGHCKSLISPTLNAPVSPGTEGHREQPPRRDTQVSDIRVRSYRQLLRCSVRYEGRERLSLAERCGRPCIGEYCGIHLGCLRKSSRRPMVCILRGVRVRSKTGLCVDCGHDCVAHQLAYTKKKKELDPVQLEFRRLAAIEVYDTIR